MLVRVAVEDAGAAGGLVQRLVSVFDADEVSFDAEAREVRVEANGTNSDRALVQTLGTVEEWLETSGYGPTKVEVFGRSYVLAPPTSDGNGDGESKL